ncbi:Altered inheritance of mitochondria protein 6 [Diaporthe australafricana]|uniref:Altered inheritance of mitochondria protein 6 n=1 Tax=Diaporthe australafricana TaxID=127596 RepID=A0ABR3WJR0_9PEZI
MAPVGFLDFNIGDSTPRDVCLDRVNTNTPLTIQRPPKEVILVAMETILEEDSSTLSQSDNCKATFPGSLPHRAGSVSREAVHTNRQVTNGRSRKLLLTRKVFGVILQDPVCLCAAWTLGALVVIGLVFVLTFLAKPSSLDATIPHDFISSHSILTNGQPIGGERKWLDEFSHSVKPKACHSHNDYQRPYPLFSALAAGCASVEADVWITDDGTDLLVGHDEASLTASRTLASMYLDPLLHILDSMNGEVGNTAGAGEIQRRGVFRTEPHATLVLLIDVKSESSKTWPLVVKQLAHLRDGQYLTRYEGDGGLKPGPVTVVGLGNVVIDRAVFVGTNVAPNRAFEEYHDAILDAPLASLPQAIGISSRGNIVSTPPDGKDQI